VKSKRKIVGLDKYEENEVIKGLNKIRTEQLEQDGSANFVSELMLKIIHAPTRKARFRDEAR
jgi:hypothetical protein